MTKTKLVNTIIIIEKIAYVLVEVERFERSSYTAL